MFPLTQFKKFIDQQELFSAKERVLVAVSGGRDSVLLVHLLNEAGFTFGIAHCNFGLRGDESDNDEQFVKELAEKFQVPFYSTKFNTIEIARDSKTSVQMAARELRYSWFEDVREKEGYHCIAIAHHASDTTETMLMNLTRGTGISGLHGILAKRGKLVRPLLFLTREEIEKIIKENSIPFREDSSNSSVKYARNKIRLEVIPKLKELNPNLDETFRTSSQRFAEIEEFLEAEIDIRKKTLFKEGPEEEILVSIQELKLLKPQRLMLFYLFKDLGFSEAVLGDLAETWDGQSGKVYRSYRYQLLIDRGYLRISKITPHSNRVESFITKDEVVKRLENFTLILQLKKAEAVKVSSKFNKAYFDADLLQFPLKIRYWKEGDYFYPFGMKGRKKLSDFFTNHKIPLTNKNQIPLLINGNGDIIWVMGYRIDDRYKIGPNTKKVYIFEKHKLHGR